MRLLERNLSSGILFACLAVSISTGRAGGPQADAASEKVAVAVKNFEFAPKEVTVKAGTTVEWTDQGGRHTVEADNGSFKSPTMISGQKFEHKFDTPGTFAYFCGVHGSKGGHDMAGKVIVTAK